MTFTRINKILEKTNAENILLLCHHNADPDAIGSAFAFKGLIERFRKDANVEIGAGKGISKLSKHLLKTLPISVNIKPNLEKADAIVLIDTNTIQQLGPLADGIKKSTAPIVVIDHHAIHPETEQLTEHLITNEKASSTCEIVYNFYKETGVKPDLNEAKALFLGIAFDTRHFVIANSSTFGTITDLVKVGVNPKEMLSLFTLPMAPSERIARIKACRRARLTTIGEWIIAVSHTSAYQASAARALVELGTHVAAVGGQRNDNVKISLRSTRGFHQQTDLHLGKDVAKPLGEHLKGMGGGHSTAAGVNGKGILKNGLELCLKLIQEKLSQN